MHGLFVAEFSTGRFVCRTRHSHNFKLVPYQPRNDVYKYSFLPRTVPEWNRLDDEIIETDCVEEFKQKLAPSMYIVIVYYCNCTYVYN